jgi:hypothetical protein
MQTKRHNNIRLTVGETARADVNVVCPPHDVIATRVPHVAVHDRLQRHLLVAEVARVEVAVHHAGKHPTLAPRAAANASPLENVAIEQQPAPRRP